MKSMTDDGITPLHIAASQGNLPCLRLLLDAGAAVDATDSQNRTPHDLSRIYGHKDCCR
jgi:ankyrin repeat protein